MDLNPQNAILLNMILIVISLGFDKISIGFDWISLDKSHESHESHEILIRFPLDLIGFHWINPMNPMRF